MMSSSGPLLLLVVNDVDFFISHRWPIAVSAKEAGYRVEIATAPGKGCEWIRSEGFKVHPVAFRRKSVNPLQELTVILELWQLYKSIQPDIVHHITIKPILYGGIAARWLRLPAVIHAVTGLGFVFAKQGSKAKLAQFVLRGMYRIALGYSRAYTIFQNPDDQAELLNTDERGRSVIIRGAGVDPEHFYGSSEPEEPVIVALASRMLWTKGVGEFVKAAEIICESGLTARFVLVGDSDPGNPECVPESQLREWNEQGTIEWWGRREDMADVLSNVHIVALPSKYREGVPKILIEAASAARPIVTTDMPGCREIVRDEVNGLLVPPGNVEKLVVALETLIKEKTLRETMGNNGRQYVIDEFSLDHVIDRTLKLYQRAIGPNGAIST